MRQFEIRYTVGNRPYGSSGVFETVSNQHFVTVVTAMGPYFAEQIVKAQNGGDNQCQIDSVRSL
jgi:hypothetical protein